MLVETWLDRDNFMSELLKRPYREQYEARLPELLRTPRMLSFMNPSEACRREDGHPHGPFCGVSESPGKLENEIWSAMPNLNDDSDPVTGKPEVSDYSAVRRPERALRYNATDINDLPITSPHGSDFGDHEENLGLNLTRAKHAAPQRHTLVAY